MNFGEFWSKFSENNGLSQSNNGSNNGVSEKKNKTELIFNFFDTDKSGTIDNNEIASIFDKAKTFNRNNNSEIDEVEADELINSIEELKAMGVKASEVVDFIKSLDMFSQNKQKTSEKLELTEEQAQNQVIEEIYQDVKQARILYDSQDNGAVTNLYDNIKNNLDLSLGSSNVEEAITLQEIAVRNLMLARDGEISKKEYYLQNKEHLVKMLTRRLYVHNKATGISVLDSHCPKNMKKEDYAKKAEEFILQYVNSISDLDSMKGVSHQLMMLDEDMTEQFMLKLLEKMDSESAKPYDKPTASKIELPADYVPQEFDSTEPITFEEVFKYERGCEYSKENVQNYIENKGVADYKLACFNKYLLAINDADVSTPEKLAELFENYYTNPYEENLPKEKLEEIIKEFSLDNVASAAYDENGKLILNLDKLVSYDAKKFVIKRISNAFTEKQKQLMEKILGGNIEDKMLELKQELSLDYTTAYGYEFSEEITQLMLNDNKTFIQKYTGDVSTGGMAAIVIGGVLCFTPLAGLGAVMVAAGGTTAIGGMVADSGLSYTEALTRDDISEEELINITKRTAMNLGGFAIGGAASKLGMKVFTKIIDKELTAIVKKEVFAGNRMDVLKTVCKDKEMMTSFVKAASSKVGIDFTLSYLGDLAMMGILDTDDDWASLLKANAIGILVGSSSDIASIGKLGHRGAKLRKLEEKAANGEPLTLKEQQEFAKLREESAELGIEDGLSQENKQNDRPDFGLTDADNSTFPGSIKYKQADNINDLYKMTKKLSNQSKLPEKTIREMLSSIDETPENLNQYSKMIAILKQNNCDISVLQEIMLNLKKSNKTPKEINDFIETLLSVSEKPDIILNDFRFGDIREDFDTNLCIELLNLHNKNSGKIRTLDMWAINSCIGISKSGLQDYIHFMQKYGDDELIKTLTDPISCDGFIIGILKNTDNEAKLVQRIKLLHTKLSFSSENYGNYSDLKIKILNLSDEKFESVLKRINILYDEYNRQHRSFNDKNFIKLVLNEKSLMVGTDEEFCRMHPSFDLLSDAEHARFEQRGITKNTSNIPLVKLSDEEFARFSARNLEPVPENIYLVKLSDEEYARFSARGLDSENIAFAKLSDEEFERFANREIEASTDNMYLIKYSDIEWNLISKYNLQKMKQPVIDILLGKGEKYIEKLNNRHLLSRATDITYDSSDYKQYFEKFADMSDEEFQIYKDRGLFEIGRMGKDISGNPCGTIRLPYEEIEIYANMNEKEWKKAQYLISLDRGLLDAFANDYNRFQEVYLMPFSAKQTVELINLTDTEFDFVKQSGALNKLSMNNVRTFTEIAKYVNYKNVDELTTADKKRLSKILIKHNESFSDPDFWQFMKTNYKDNFFCKTNYCSLLSKLVRESRIEVNKISKEQQLTFENTVNNMSRPNSAFLNADFETKGFSLQMEYPREQFMKDIMDTLEGLSTDEKQKIMDYYGFEVYTKDGQLVMSGYPAVLKSIPDLTSPQGKKVKELVERYSDNNKIRIDGNSELSKMLNDIFDTFPELKGIIGKVQHGMHDYTVDVHTLKVLQNVMSNPNFKNLSPQEQKILTIATLMHDISKKELEIDKSHPQNSADESYQLLMKMDLAQEERENIYAIIKNHDWLERYNKEGITREQQESVSLQIAYELRSGNNFKMAAMLAEADLKGVKRNDEFFSVYKGALENGIKEINQIVNRLKTHSLYIPQTRIPKASELKVDGYIVEERVIKGHKVKILHLRKGEDLSSVGFPAGTKSDDIQVFYHGLNYDAQLEIYNTGADISSEIVLSNSILSTAKPIVYANYGLISYTSCSNILAGSYMNIGSGYNTDKTVSNLVERYLNEKDIEINYMNWFQNKMKKKLNLSDSEYVNLYDEIKGKSMTELREYNPEVANAMDVILFEADLARRNAPSTGFNGQHVTEFLIHNYEKQAIGCPYGEKYLDEMPEFLLSDAENSDLVVVCID